MCLIGFTASLDVAIALPHIAKDLKPGDKYIPVANCFLFAQSVVQPGVAQLCDMFGRRWPTILSVHVALFALGSGIAGGANNAAAMITGRTVQGLGSGGIMLIVELVVYDMVSPRDRGKYLGIVLSTAALGAIIGPVVGGALA
ncbi:macrolide phosphotransferase k [Metarhizium guizhouense ARSEF 977]|uniref:Macrolide phosphotransferase k n=1 Tax=Metarhizium guizhouense (strain ARSEF 977) TaxID=1276136 RepID=A0A0B4GFZ3_METGA|nr:macrolide phosphotransferase k [Metarhizium guizhouense ARSEF 977]